MAALRLFSVLLLVSLATAQASNPVVRVAQGLLQGTWKVSTNGRTYASFEGVPYARPPVGKYRFREPQQMKPWAGTWDATKPLTDCLQFEPFYDKVIGSENCLFANIHTPILNAGANLPVVVYIHGGAFMYGAGGLYGAESLMDRDVVVVTFNYRLGPLVNLPVVVYIHGGAFMCGAGGLYGAESLMDRDVVVVTFNYRLGPLGFLSTGDEQAPGNAGLKDQSFLLRWVQQNIMMFGGNPDSVTLTGCSAGGASVHYHYLSPLSKGLFARGIAFSGSAFASWTHAVKPAQKARTLASIVGCPVTTTREMVDCLKYRPAEVLVNAQTEMFEWKGHAYFTPFVPTAEGPTVRDPFLSQYPYHAAQSAHRLPLITSITSDEGLYPAAMYQKNDKSLPELEARWDELASYIFEYNDTLPLNRRPAVAAQIKQKYLNNKPVSQETFPQLVQALGDRLFGVEVGRHAQTHALRSGQPVYVYRFTHRGSNSLSSLFANRKDNYGVCHADDVLQIFSFPGVEFTTAEDKKMANALIDMVYSYATTGVPKLSSSGTAWLPVTPGAPELNYLEISSPTKQEMKSTSDFAHKSFWDNLGFIENANYQITLRDEL